MYQFISQCGRAGRSFTSVAIFAVVLFLTFFGLAASSDAAPSTDANLSAIGLLQGSLSPSFSAGTLNYTVSVPNGVPATKVWTYKSAANATVTVNGTPVAGDGSSGVISLPVGLTTILIKVTAEDATTTQTYNVVYNRAGPPANADLNNLVLSSGSLSPSFNSGTVSYVTTVANEVTSVTVTPIVADATSTVKVNGTGVTSGSPSGSISLVEGSNTITAVVTAQDGTTMRAYTVTVTRSAPPPPSSDASLRAIGVTNASLSSAFSPGTTSYTAFVANNIPSMRVIPYASEANATITVNGSPVVSGATSGAISLAVGATPVTILVTAADGVTTQTYTITVNRALSSNADLAGLTLSGVPLSPSFSAGTVSYTATVANSVSSITAMPTVMDPTATVTVNGTPVTSGSASGTISLAVGANTITTVVTAADATTKTYTATVTRSVPPPASSDATLVGIGLSNSRLSPAFSSGTLFYNSTVANNIPAIRVTPYASDANATITVNGIPVVSGAMSGAINVAVGSNPVTILVTAEDGLTTKTYTVDISRAPSTNAGLGSLYLSRGSLSPSFNVGTASYTASVPNGTSTITVTLATADPTATVTINGTIVTSGSASAAIPLIVGSNTITIVTTAQDGTTTKTYTVAVTRLLASNADLSGLSLSSGTLSPSFAAGTTSYTAAVANSVASITLTPMVADPAATVTVNGATVVSGSASGAIALAVGTNTITTVATAQDGATAKTYTVTVTRAAPVSANADLSGLSLSSGTLSPSFAAGTTSYTAAVANSVASITLTPMVADPAATVTVNGATVVSGSASGA
ncbi:cadherin-like beta sandwich domain-containing protein, partial [Rhizobium sp. Root73]|uniref:beta strand repeat-containing protein n=2 Tax=unclassified Rhizobium TaxID=2613769 RepID=UPI00138EE5C1